MIFKGLFGLPSVDSKTGQEYIQGIPFATIQFVNDTTKEIVSTDVDSLGKYSITLNNGSYYVQAFIRGSSQSISYIRQGVVFVVNDKSVESDFDTWLQTSQVEDNDPLLARWEKVLFDLKAEHKAIMEDIQDASKTGQDKAIKAITAEGDKQVARVDVEANKAETSATNAKASETKAKTSETNAKTSETKSKTSETNSKASETASATSATNAKSSETASKASQTASKTSETNASKSATASATSATASETSAVASKTSETNAKTSQTASKTSETNSKNSENLAKKWANNPVNTPVTGTDYSAMHWAKEAEKSVGGVNNEVQKALDKKWNIQETVGNTNGKVMREGAHGLGVSNNTYSIDIDVNKITHSGIYNLNNSSINTPNPTHWWGVIQIGNGRGQIAVRTSGGGNQELWVRTGVTDRPQEEQEAWAKAYLSNQTRTDKSGVVHDGTKTPINTLNTSDLTDHIQAGLNQPVTSSAVFKAMGLPVGHTYWNLQVDVGSLHLDGSEKKRSDYPDLWALVSKTAIAEATWQADKTKYGNVGKYSVGNGTTTFRLPLINGYIKGGGGGYQEAGLPNITGHFHIASYSDQYTPLIHTTDLGGLVKPPLRMGSVFSGVTFSESSGHWFRVGLDASNSSNVYGKANTVEVNSVKGFYQVRAYGQVSKVASIEVDALISEINTKASIELVNDKSDKSYVEEVLKTKQDTLDIDGSGKVLTTSSTHLLDSLGVRSDRNTITDSNGFVKTASPVIHLFSDHIKHNNQFDEEPTLEKLGVGIYKITGTLGLAEGLYPGDWYVQLPEDRYGEPYFNVEYERLEDGVILRVYERIELYVPSERKILDREGNPVEVKEKLVLNGDQIDLKPEWRCIDLRFKEEESEKINPPMEDLM